MKKLLVVVDYQNDFVNGALGFEGADEIEDEIVRLIDEFEKNMNTYTKTIISAFKKEWVY